MQNGNLKLCNMQPLGKIVSVSPDDLESSPVPIPTETLELFLQKCSEVNFHYVCHKCYDPTANAHHNHDRKRVNADMSHVSNLPLSELSFCFVGWFPLKKFIALVSLFQFTLLSPA